VETCEGAFSKILPLCKVFIKPPAWCVRRKAKSSASPKENSGSELDSHGEPKIKHARPRQVLAQPPVGEFAELKMRLEIQTAAHVISQRALGSDEIKRGLAEADVNVVEFRRGPSGAQRTCECDPLRDRRLVA